MRYVKKIFEYVSVFFRKKFLSFFSVFGSAEQVCIQETAEKNEFSLTIIIVILTKSDNFE